MLSDHLQKIDRTSSRNLFLIASVLVIVCQLVAMALVAGSQVQRAELRESRLTAQNIAMAKCLEASARFDRQACMLQQPDTDRSSAVAASLAMDKPAGLSHAALPAATQGFMAVAFGAN
ncbi:MAG: hypothetical protein V4455_11475 [Pseudomonadota bacterium]